MEPEWTHVGRLWTNGEPFVAIDAALRDRWLGWTENEFDRVIELGLDTQTLAVGTGRAALVGGDGVVRDDSWIEIFEADNGTLAIVQASGDDYRRVLTAALHYPAVDGDDAGILSVPTGEIAFFSAACDGAGEYSVPLLSPRPGPVPTEHGPPTPGADPGFLIRTGHTTYRFQIRWYTRIDDDGCFARWLLIPLQIRIPTR